MKIAKEKVWVDAEGELVKDGDPNASVLVAAKGQEMADSEVKQYKNASAFFKDASASAKSEPENKEEENGEEENEEASLDGTVEELREVAEMEGVDLTGIHVKADIIKAIKKHRKRNK